MYNTWNDAEAQRYVEEYGKRNISCDLALRVYTSRLLGRCPALVLHGGGNTSVKTVAADIFADEVEVLCVKGSGWDLADIEPQGLPAVRLRPLLRLRGLEALSDEDMINTQRGNLLDSTAPNPSVETLLHAFLPHKFIDHTHATAVLAVSDQPHGEQLCREIYGRRMAIVPFIMPGFALAKSAAEIFDLNPDVEGLILHKHGIFTFGESAQEAYERMIDMVTLAEAHLARGRRPVFSPVLLPAAIATAEDVAPIVRGACAEKLDENGNYRRLVLELRSGSSVMEFVNGEGLADYSRRGVVTPDHTIRTKNKPLVLPVPRAGDLEDFAIQVHARVDAYIAEYREYFARHNAHLATPKTQLDPYPRVALVPGIGLFGMGMQSEAARIAADLYENAISVISAAESIGTFDCLGEAELFDMEYWSLEQAKLGKVAEKPLTRQIAVVTGAAGAIGRATAQAFAAAGAEVALLDLDGPAVDKAAAEIAGNAIGLTCDLTDSSSVAASFSKVSRTFGGLDIVVSNAGTAPQGRIGTVSDAVLQESFEINFFAHQRVARASVAIMRAQGTGGVLLFNVSKQAVNPGANFGPYGLPKAATMFLVRQYALDYGTDGIRANGVNADKIRSGLMTDEMIASRSQSRGLSEVEYMTGNLLSREVLAEDVAQAFVHLALAQKTTGDITTVDGGNIAAALR